MEDQGIETTYIGILDAVFSIEAKDPLPGDSIYTLRPTMKRYTSLIEAGFSANIVMLVDKLLSAADSSPAPAHGPGGEPKPRMDVFNDFCESLRQAIEKRPGAFGIGTPAPENNRA